MLGDIMGIFSNDENKKRELSFDKDISKEELLESIYEDLDKYNKLQSVDTTYNMIMTKFNLILMQNELLIRQNEEIIEALKEIAKK